MAGNVTQLGEARVDITGDLSKLDKSFDSALAMAQTKTKQIADTFAKLGGTLTKTVTLPIVGAFAASFKAIEDQEQALAKLNAVIRATGGVAGVTSEHVQTLASQLQKNTVFADEVTTSGAAMLLTFRSIRNELGEGNDVFDRTIKAAQDMAALFDGDLNQSILQLGKALEEPTVGLTALRRSGVSFTESQKDLIKSLVESGDLLGAQKIVLKAVEEQFNGTAQAVAQTAGGQLKQAMNELGEVGETVGAIIAPVIRDAAQSIKELAGEFQKLEPETQANVVKTLAFAAAVGPALIVLGSMAGAVSGLIGLIRTLSVAYTALAASQTLAGVSAAASALFMRRAAVQTAATTAITTNLQNGITGATTANAVFNFSLLQTIKSVALLAAKIGALIVVWRIVITPIQVAASAMSDWFEINRKAADQADATGKKVSGLSRFMAILSDVGTTLAAGLGNVQSRMRLLSIIGNGLLIIINTIAIGFLKMAQAATETAIVLGKDTGQSMLNLGRKIQDLTLNNQKLQEESRKTLADIRKLGDGMKDVSSPDIETDALRAYMKAIEEAGKEIADLKTNIESLSDAKVSPESTFQGLKVEPFFLEEISPDLQDRTKEINAQLEDLAFNSDIASGAFGTLNADAIKAALGFGILYEDMSLTSDGIVQVSGRTKELVDAFDRMKLAQVAADAVASLGTASDKASDEQAQLKAAVDAGFLSVENYNAVLKKAADAIVSVGGKWAEMETRLEDVNFQIDLASGLFGDLSDEALKAARAAGIFSQNADLMNNPAAIRSVEDLGRALAKLSDIEKGKDIVASVRTEQERLGEETAELTRLWENGTINGETYQRAIAKVNERLFQLRSEQDRTATSSRNFIEEIGKSAGMGSIGAGGFFGGLAGGILNIISDPEIDIFNAKTADLIEIARRSTTTTEGFFESMAQGVGQSMQRTAKALQDGTFSFDTFTKDLLDTLTQTAIQIATNQVISQIFGAFLGGLGGGLSPNNLISGGAIPGFANGGNISAGQLSLVGERGPELFRPQSSGSIIPLDDLNGGPTMNVVQNFNVTTGVQQTVRAEIQSFLPRFREEAVRAVTDANQRGGSVRSAMRA